MDEAGDILYSPSPSSTTLPWACHRLKKERGQIQTCEHLGRLQAVYVSPKLELAMPKAHVCGECVSLANHCLPNFNDAVSSAVCHPAPRGQDGWAAGLS